MQNVQGTVNVAAVLEPGLVKRDGNLAVAVLRFNYELDGKRQTFPGVLGEGLTDDAWNYVYLDFDGSLNVSTSGFPTTTHVRLAKVKTSAGAIVEIVDERVLLAAGIDREINREIENGQSSTTDLVNWAEKVRLDLVDIPAGTYIIQWYCELRHSNGVLTNFCEMRCEANDLFELGYAVWPYNVFEDAGGFTIYDLAGGSHHVDLDFRVQGGGTAYVRRARILVWRIA